ncbi:MAG: sodium:proton antiporter [Chloroflexota bacterium]|nr:sodium:proton antiporter [Chloroflexota bacterium]
MILLLSLVVGILFGSGTFLMMKRDLLRVVAGVLLISNASILLIMSAGLSRGSAPIYPLAEGTRVSDPLVQALALTAIVISFGATALLLSIVYRVYLAHHSVDQEGLLEQETRDEVEREQEMEPEREVL